jgi:hypothetical protein
MVSLAPQALLRAAELRLRQAARLIELDPAEESQRVSRIIFRLASRLQTDREAAA